MIQTFTLPSPPPQPSNKGYPEFRNWLQSYGDRLLNYFFNYHTALSSQFNNLLNGAGPDLTDPTGTLTITNSFHQVTGSPTITTINQGQGQSATGVLCLYAQSGFTLATGGNISPAMSVDAGQCALLCFSPALNLWTGVTTLNLLEDDGGSIASASAITVSKAFYTVTGQVTINTINQASPPKVGPLCLYAQDGFILGTGGNIATAMTVLPTRCAILFYSPTLSKWTGISQPLLEGQGATLASAASIAVTNMFHQITGTVTVTTITGPPEWLNFALGPLVLYAVNGFLINTGGNIADVLLVQPQGIAVLFYSPVVGAWTGITFALGPRAVLGGGAAATLGTTGGTGPVNPAQNSWIKMTTNAGAFWIPVWQ